MPLDKTEAQRRDLPKVTQQVDLKAETRTWLLLIPEPKVFQLHPAVTLYIQTSISTVIPSRLGFLKNELLEIKRVEDHVDRRHTCPADSVCVPNNGPASGHLLPLQSQRGQGWVDAVALVAAEMHRWQGGMVGV